MSATVVCASLILAGCGNDEPAPEYELSGSAMGTRYSVKIAEAMSTELMDRLERDIRGVIDGIENHMSTYIVESDVSRFNASRSTDWMSVSRDVCDAVVASLELSELTHGAFDITVGPLVNLWGFGPDTVELAPPPPEEIAAAKARVGYGRLHADCSKPALRKDEPDVYIDLSAWAKGFAVDRVSELLDDADIGNYLVALGGELRMRGRNAGGERWSVAIEKPSDDGSSVQMVLRLTDRAVSTSGDYRNYFVYEGQRYSHLIDAREGRPVSHNLASVTVIADKAAFADPMATALLVLGPEEGMELAIKERIAAFFQLRTVGGFDEKTSPAFAALAADAER
ncbi:MAG TPA: FAD:protein FMN transferase [Woeseiaceae bacterium]|nr:FAD:protein FMN transferase [Woeseiaceae bacterium]